MHSVQCSPLAICPLYGFSSSSCTRCMAAHRAMDFRAGHTDLRRMANFIFLDIPEAQGRSALLHLVSVSPIVLVAANKGLLCRYHALRFSTQPLPIKNVWFCPSVCTFVGSS